MGSFIDLTGKRYNKLVVLRRVGTLRKQPLWLCQCDCGKQVEAISGNLKSGNTKSCGCLRHDFNFKHGQSKSRLYRIWSNMKARCDNPNRPKYTQYGGRGIKVCKEWHDNFNAFRDWSIKNGYGDMLSLDRIDVDKGYNPDNCRWANNMVQAHNKQLDKLYTYNGKTLSVRDWCKEIGFYWTLFSK